MSKASDTAQLRRLQQLAALPDEQIDTSDLPVIEDWSQGVRGGTPADVRRKLARIATPHAPDACPPAKRSSGAGKGAKAARSRRTTRSS